ncbi:sigma-70 family RNA polymerase sigma factor, partial [Candidatus Gottesmanbacteria bacterium]|nr:sigma-70 family RNA polymerase sigma factor [Candidatus Gottesmanbacteria bacterium]
IKKDQLAIKTLHNQYSLSLFSFIASKIERKEDVEEILQDTWISIFDSLPLFAGRCSLLTWAKTIALHEVADFYRKRKIKSLVFSHLPFLENLVSQALGPEMVCQQKEIKREVEKVFASLSEGYRQILRLKYIEGFTVAQIGKSLRLSFKSTESRLFRARLAFQKSWNENYLKSPFGFSSFLASKRGI